jgi:tetratricopeptide (TPR) repeat protein
MAVPSNQLRVGIISLLLVTLVWSVYLPVIWFDFTNYDDPDYVLENVPVLNGLTWEGIRWAFTHFHSGNWHPVTWISHMLDCQVYGLGPAGHHITNVLFHTFNTLLLFGLLHYLTNSVWRSATVAALFAVHPLHVESVAWISERKDVLSAFFGLLSLWAYAFYVKRDIPRTVATAEFGSNPNAEMLPTTPYKSIFYLSSLFLLALGLMSKSMLVTWPFVMLLMDYWPLGRMNENRGMQHLRNLFFEKLPFFLLSAGACIVTILSQRSGAALAPLAAAPLDTRILNSIVSFLRYSEKLIWPSHLSVIYLDTGAPPWILVLLAIVTLLTVTLLAWHLRGRSPYVLVGWLWFLGMLVPVIGLVKVGSHSIADRYTYLPAVGFFIMAIWGLGSEAVADSKRRILAVFAAGITILFIVVAQKQVLVWQNTETLFRHAAAVTRDNYVAQNSLGFYFADLRQYDLAERVFRKSLVIHPGSAPAWNKLGSVMINRGRYPEAEMNCRTALRIYPQMPEAHTTLGLALLKQGKTNEALVCYSEALRFKPDYAPAHYNLANTLVNQGQFDLAAQHYQNALRTDPRSADSHNNLAYILRRQQKLDQAADHFKSALRLRPTFWQASYGLGELMLKKNRFTEAAAELSRVIELRPDLALAHFQLALAFAGQGKRAEAIESAEQAHLLSSRNGQQELASRSLELRERLSAPNQ